MDLNDRENMAPYIRGARDVDDPPNIVHLLHNRQLGMTRKKFPTGLKQFAELKASRSQLKETHCDLPASARSTFLMSFSHDCTRIASTHGDHNIYVSEMKTGKPIKTLEGHPRTPWCIAFHPTSNDILASGCLAGEVRVWDLRGGGSERWRAEHDQVIASLAFHPTDQLLVIATGNSLYFWNWSNPAPDGHCSTNNDLERVRYVKFDPLGFRIITGIANLNNSGFHTGTCGLASAGLRTNPTCRRRIPRDVDIYRACRRDVMETLLNFPELAGSPSQPPRGTSNSTQENDSSSSSFSSSASVAANQAGTSHETNTSRSSGVNNESRLHGNSRDRSPIARRVSPTDQQLLRESVCEDVARIVNQLLDQFLPSLFRSQRTSSTELEQTSRTTSEDEINTAISASESQQTVRTTPGDDFNTAISQVNNEGFNVEDMLHSIDRLRGFFDNFEEQLSAAALKLNEASASASQSNSGQINETSEPRAGPSHSRSIVVQANETSEPRAGPSHSRNVIVQANETSEPTAGPSHRSVIVQANETSEPRAGPSESDSESVIVQANETFEPRAGPSESDGGSGMQTNETSESQAGPSQRDDECKVFRRVLRSGKIFEPRASPSESDNRRRFLRCKFLKDVKTSEPQAGPSQSDNGSAIIQNDNACEPKAGFSQNNDKNQMSNIAELTSRSENGGVKEKNQPEPKMPRRNRFISTDEEVTELHRSLWNVLSKPGSRCLQEQRSTGANTPLSQISASEHQSAEMKNTLRNPPATLPNNVEKPTVNESDGDIISRSSPIRVQLPRHHYNRLKSEKRSNSSCFESDKEMSESKRQKKEFDETTRSLLENSTSTAQASGSPQSPVIPNLSSAQTSIDMPSSPVTTPAHSSPVAMSISSFSVASEASSTPTNVEDSDKTNFSRPMTMDLLSDITDEDFPVIGEGTNNHESDMLSAEANTQTLSSSDSRNFLLRPITLEDMRDECIFTSLFTTHQCDALRGCMATAGPSTAQIPTGSYRELQVEDQSDSDSEFEIPQPQEPFPSSFSRIENITDSDLELENPPPQSPVPSSPVTSDVEFTSGSGSGSSRRLSSYFDPIIEPLSDASSDDSDRPSTPPLLMFSQPYNSLLFTGHSRIALNDPLTQNHRIQVWDFTAGEFPPIYDATANIVVRRCMIHNDASVDISQDGEKLVALIPPEERDLININNLMFGVFSLRPGHLGRTLCIWGYISNAISVSFSPLAQYVVVGSANSRPIYSNPEKAAVAQIIKINKSRDSYDASYIRSFTQVINNDNRLQQVSLNCVKWLPVSGLGIAYATNRGCLCICKPIAGEMFENVPNEASPESVRLGQILHRIRAFYRPRP